MVFNFKVPERIEIPIDIIRNLNRDVFFDEIKACVGEDLASKLRSKKTLNLDADDDMKYDSFRRRIGLQPGREPLSDFDILLVTKAFAKKDLFDKYLAQIEVTYKDELSKLKAKEQAPKEQKAGFDTGDGLAQNIQANPVSDNKPNQSATGLVFDTVPDQPQQPQDQPTTQTDLNSVIYGTGNNNNNQTQNNGEQKPKGKRPWCKYMLDRGSDAYLREKFKQLGRNDFDQVISIMRQLLSNRSAIELIYNITREANLLFGIRGVVDANNFSLWAYINEKEIICCDFHNGTLNAYKQPSNQ